MCVFENVRLSREKQAKIFIKSDSWSLWISSILCREERDKHVKRSLLNTRYTCAAFQRRKNASERKERRLILSTSLDLTSRSKTILRAFDRLQNEPVLSAKFAKIGTAFKGEKTINALLLGCDRREGINDGETKRIFKDLGKERGVNLSLFGPNLVFDDDDENLTSRGRSNESESEDDVMKMMGGEDKGSGVRNKRRRTRAVFISREKPKRRGKHPRKGRNRIRCGVCVQRRRLGVRFLVAEL